MELWGWLIGYVALFALLHLVLYYVYVRRENSDGAPAPSFADGNHFSSHPSSGADGYSGPRDGPEEDDPSTLERTLEFDGETIRCVHCGARNEADQTFTYCWNCISSLRQ
ncbi:DUF2797 domain-containing protein [Natrononativus amylolyticus]|uniref:DUF2797 domain-containing protein n=1 Tax=Natrononativus amylolyticus TaxID=2963434 RepID=UPI0020CC25F4|nr:DUF2797 domain-containing protein [Natrononativus amylolyticus]